MNSFVSTLANEPVEDDEPLTVPVAAFISNDFTPACVETDKALVEACELEAGHNSPHKVNFSYQYHELQHLLPQELKLCDS